jgi:hypothetical protein
MQVSLNSISSYKHRAHGHVKLLTRVILPVPSISPLMCFGIFALAQHCSATRRISSISSSLSLNWRFASLLLRSLTPFSSTWVEFANGMTGCVTDRFWSACDGRSETGEATRLSRFTHSAIRAWMLAESCVARESRYGHMSPSSLQNGSEAIAERSAGRMCGRGGRDLFGCNGCSCWDVLPGEAMDVVERRDAAMVRRMWVSVERVVDTTHAVI